MSTSISIIGASGAVGSMLAVHLLRGGLLKSADRLQLVGHGIASSSAQLLSNRIDLLDAFDDEGVDIEVVANIEDVDGDIVLICAGVSLPGNLVDRRDWGKTNLALFEQIARVCCRRVPDALFVVVSNPVELAVKVFSEKLGRERVIGMGAEQDSLGFARAIAHDLDISRQYVMATVLGEHGQAMVPVWSSVQLKSMDQRLSNKLARMKEESATVPLTERVLELRAKVLEFIEAQRVSEAYETTRQALPDARIFVQPFITWYTMHSTPNATANSTLRFLTAARDDGATPLHGQVLLRGEFLGIEGVCGVPLAVSRQGWEADAGDSLSPEEQYRVLQAARSIDMYISSVLLS
jgi:malate dehydrogenase